MYFGPRGLSYAYFATSKGMKTSENHRVSTVFRKLSSACVHVYVCVCELKYSKL